MIYLIVFFLGLIVGSFANVCIYRIPRGESIAYPASHCTACGTSLKAVDLVPVLSYLFLRGSCRYCKSAVSVQYPLIELLCGAIFVLLFREFSLSFLFIKYSIISCTLLVVALIDLKTQEIPDGLLIFGAIAAVLFISVDKAVPIRSALMGAGLGFGIFLAIALLSNGMGGGDIKLMALIGLAVGWKQVLLISLFSFIIGAVISLLLIALKIKGRKDFIPFAPFIFAAFMLVLLWGDRILEFYLKFI